MAVFELDAAVTHPLDYQLIKNGFVTLFHERSILDHATAWLLDQGYRVVTLDADDWRQPADLHRQLADGLHFPDHYGANIDALNDCLSDVAEGQYGLSLQDTGLVLTILHFDSFLRRQAETAHAFLNTFSARARGAALFGHRMLCLLQSHDRAIQVPPIGASRVAWNPAEWTIGGSSRLHT